MTVTSQTGNLQQIMEDFVEVLSGAADDIGRELGHARADVMRELGNAGDALGDAVEREAGNAQEAVEEGFSCFGTGAEVIERRTAPQVMPDVPELPDLAEVKFPEISDMAETPDMGEKFIQFTENADIPIWSAHLPQNVIEGLEQSGTRWESEDSAKFSDVMDARAAEAAQELDPADYARIGMHTLTGDDGQLPDGVSRVKWYHQVGSDVDVNLYQYKGANNKTINIVAVEPTDFFSGRSLNTGARAFAQGGRAAQSYKNDMKSGLEDILDYLGAGQDVHVVTGHSQGALGAETIADILRSKGKKAVVVAYNGQMTKRRKHSISYRVEGDRAGFYTDHVIQKPQKFFKIGNNVKIPIGAPRPVNQANRTFLEATKPIAEPVMDVLSGPVADALGAVADTLGFGLVDAGDIAAPVEHVVAPVADGVEDVQGFMQETMLDLAGPLESLVPVGVSQEVEQEVEVDNALEAEQ